MDQLTGLDATFLYMESETQFGHVSGLSIFARPDDPGYDPLTAWRAEIERRLHLLEPLRRRVRDVPFRLDDPFWEDDPDFDLEYRVRHTTRRCDGRGCDRLADRQEFGVTGAVPMPAYRVLVDQRHRRAADRPEDELQPEQQPDPFVDAAEEQWRQPDPLHIAAAFGVRRRFLRGNDQ